MHVPRASCEWLRARTAGMRLSFTYYYINYSIIDVCSSSNTPGEISTNSFYTMFVELQEDSVNHIYYIIIPPTSFHVFCVPLLFILLQCTLLTLDFTFYKRVWSHHLIIVSKKLVYNIFIYLTKLEDQSVWSVEFDFAVHVQSIEEKCFNMTKCLEKRKIRRDNCYECCCIQLRINRFRKLPHMCVFYLV